MTAPPPTRLGSDRAELERRLRAVRPAVRLVSQRHLGRVERHLRDAGGPSVGEPGRWLWVDRDWLRQAELFDNPPDDGPEARQLLVAAADDLLVDDLADDRLLRYYWRLLFRAAVAAEVTRPADRLRRLGPVVVREARFVLTSDHVVPFGAADAELSVAFAATLLDLAAFAPESIPVWFPSVADPAAVLAVVGDGIDRDSLKAGSRPAGAAEAEPSDGPVLAPVADPEEAAPAALAADQMARRGNVVRAAIWYTRAARRDGPDADRHRDAAEAAVRDGLVPKLAAVMGWDEARAAAWTAALLPLPGPASRGTWPPAARALYDLQKLALDLSGELYAVDTVEWLRSFGRRPIKRPLTRARAVILLRRLAGFEKHLIRTPLRPADREALDRLVHAERHVVELRVRADLGPVVRGVLDEVGLKPTGVVERVARDKVVQELLDRICGRGFLRIGDLRDAVARNQLKLRDLSGAGEFFAGDPLLKADTRLAGELYGIYRRGEFYLRGIQRFSAVAFGTAVGRFVTKYVALPFGGAYVALEGVQHLIHPILKLVAAVETLATEPPTIDPHAAGGGPAAAHAPHGPVLATLPAVLVLGFVLLGLLHAPPFRRAVFDAAKGVWSWLRFLVVDLPRAVWRSPPVRFLVGNPASRFVFKYFGSALLATPLVFAVGVLAGVHPWRALAWGGVAFAGVAALTNTPFGRRLQEETAEAAADGWRTIRADLVPAVINWVLWLFRELVGLLERGLYAVDEWFRFRPGQGKPSLALKAVLALVWFPVAYVIRFAFYLLLEPQVNPVKHFPVVTVSHKLLLPLVPSLAASTGVAEANMLLIVSGIPGIFGFLVWELKENWRLYAANRPETLRPVPLGHHGETMRGLLRPGFHSGTVPKQFRKLRYTAADPHAGQPEALTVRTRHELDHIRHAVEAFFERELVPLLAAAESWGGRRLEVAAVRLGCQRVVVELAMPESNATVVFENRGGVIVGEVGGSQSGLSASQREALNKALAGVLQLGAVRGHPDGSAAEPVRWAEWVAFWEKRAKAENAT